MWIIFKVFIEFVIKFLLFYVLVFWPQEWRIFASQPAIKSAHPALVGKVLNIVSPGKSWKIFKITVRIELKGIWKSGKEMKYFFCLLTAVFLYLGAMYFI